MAFNKKTSYGESLNILESEVGLVLKTREATAAMATNGIIKAGALFTGTDEFGVVAQDYDMTGYEKYPISVVFQGRLKADRVAAEVTAKATELKAQGLYLI